MASTSTLYAVAASRRTCAAFWRGRVEDGYFYQQTTKCALLGTAQVSGKQLSDAYLCEMSNLYLWI